MPRGRCGAGLAGATQGQGRALCMGIQVMEQMQAAVVAISADCLGRSHWAAKHSSPLKDTDTQLTHTEPQRPSSPDPQEPSLWP